jgi:hypothetical protein
MRMDLRAYLRDGLGAAPFDEAGVAAAPATRGVYFLYRDHRVIYIGVAVHGTGIRQELQKHLSGAYGARTRTATAFDFEQTRHPVVARSEYLAAHMARHRGQLPRCNQQESPTFKGDHP